MGIWTGGDSWQSKPRRHRGDNLPINRMHGRRICYRAISMISTRAQRDRRLKTSRPQPGPFQGMNYSSGPGAGHHGELHRQAPNSCIHSDILGRCFLKQLGSPQLCSWEGGNTAQGCSTNSSPWSPAEPSHCLQSMGLEDTKRTPAANSHRPSHNRTLQPSTTQHRGCLLLFLIYCDPALILLKVPTGTFKWS